MSEDADSVKDVPEAAQFVPDPAQFRAWLQTSLADLGISARSLSREINGGPNLVSQFLAKPDRNISLSSAHDISCKIFELARSQNKALPAPFARD